MTGYDFFLMLLMVAQTIGIFVIVLLIERVQMTLQAILVHTIKTPNETARPTDSYL